jgi:YD repeat-containing protein
VPILKLNLARQAVNGALQYVYSAAQNNGQITQMVDTVSGETISYQYDALKRLTSASSTAAWNQTYQYDGFGNLTAKAAAPIPVDAATNRLSNAFYDANGNMTWGSGVTLTYDEANRVASAVTVQVVERCLRKAHEKTSKNLHVRPGSLLKNLAV